MTNWKRPFSEQFPLLAEACSPLVLADLPTPVQQLSNLSNYLGHSELWIKRDDLSSTLYGGNKVRKLEFLLGRARREEATTVLTMGGTGSNHLLATALHSRTIGARTVGVVFPQPDCKEVLRNQAADLGVGVEIVKSPSKYLLPLWVASTMARLSLIEGRTPLLIPGGGSSPTGALGFVNAGLELAQQIKAGLLPEPAAIFVPYGTGGTAVGLAIGIQLASLSTRIVAVRVIDRLLANQTRLDFLARSIVRLLGSLDGSLKMPLKPASNLELRHGYIGSGYGHPTQDAQDAVFSFEEGEGISLESTYTGKTAAAFIEETRRTKGPLLFWNTYSSADISQWVEAGSCSSTN